MVRLAGSVALAATLAASRVYGEDNGKAAVMSTESVKHFNSSVAGRVRIGTPWALPCYTKYKGSYLSGDVRPNERECDQIGKDMDDSDELIQDFGSYHNPSFATCMNRDEKCTVSMDDFQGVQDETCYQGTVPDFYLDARDAYDIQQAMQFARKYKLPVTVKNTGHDYKGRSTGVNTVAIWTHNIQPEPKIDEDFVPESCSESAGPVVTYGAGQTSRDLYEKLDGSGYFSVGGSCTTVGVSGGWVAGGGHSIVSPTFGLGVDNVVQMKVVLPDGTYVTANRCTNQDIFFALRGGGGGTFGVVTETTAKLHKDRKFTYAQLTMTLPSGTRDMNEIMVAHAERWADEGWGGLYGVDDTGTLTYLGYNPNLSEDEAKESMKPITDYMKSVAKSSDDYVANITTLASHWEAQNQAPLLGFLATEAGVTLTRSSRLVPRSVFKTAEGQKKVVDVLEKKGWASVLGAPTAFDLPDTDQTDGPGFASVTPAWREAVWHFTYTATWDQADANATKPETLSKTFSDISKAMDPMRAITPDGGAYQNEGDVYEPDPVGSFWGHDNYARLLSIKKKLDPNNLMSCWTCVGWNKDDHRHSCYLDVESKGPSPPATGGEEPSGKECKAVRYEPVLGEGEKRIEL